MDGKRLIRTTGCLLWDIICDYDIGSKKITLTSIKIRIKIKSDVARKEYKNC